MKQADIGFSRNYNNLTTILWTVGSHKEQVSALTLLLPSDCNTAVRDMIFALSVRCSMFAEIHCLSVSDRRSS